MTVVNALGGFDIAADRLAVIDGEGAFFYSTNRSHYAVLIGTPRILSRPLET